MTQLFAQFNERNNWVILTLKVESLVELKFDPTFKVKISQFFSQCTDRKNESFLPKSWDTGGIIIRLGKASNWRKFESIWLSMLSQLDSQCWVNLTLNVESIWLSMLSQFDSQCWVNSTLNVESIWLKYSPVTHFAGSNFSSASDSTFYVKMTFFFSVYHTLQT